MHWFNANGSALQFFAAIALILVTAAYVVLTYRIVRQNQELVRSQSRPDVVVLLEADPDHAAYFVVQNVGPGVARNVRITTDDEWSVNRDLGRIGDIGFVAHGIPVMPPGARLYSFIAVTHHPRFSSIEPLQVHVEYEGADGSHAAEFVLDARLFVGMKPGPRGSTTKAPSGSP
jgi:hypothetical protein